jgi:ribosome biogenesis protein UTP30
MAAKAATSAKKSKVAKTLKSPQTTKADKVATKTRKKHRELTKEERMKTGLDAALVQKAAEALLKYHETQNSDKLSLLGNDQAIQVQFTLLRTPETPVRKPTRITIPHPLFQLKTKTDGATATLEEPEICLIVKEESKPWCQEMIERFPEYMGCVKKVMGLQSLRSKHSRYEQRRALLNKYNIFMADDRILPMLSKALGTDFYKAKKLPIPISLTRKEALPFAIQKALSATYMSISKGTCIMIR